MDTIFFKNIEIACKVGTTPEERAFPQITWISLTAQLDLTKAGVTDELNQSIDYAVLLDEIRNQISTQTFNLIESIAEKTAQITLKYPPVKCVEVSVKKKIFVGVDRVGVTITRSK